MIQTDIIADPESIAPRCLISGQPALQAIGVLAVMKTGRTFAPTLQAIMPLAVPLVAALEAPVRQL